MDKELQELYKLYQQSGNSETYDQFLSAKDLLGDDAFFSFVDSQISDVKKKDIINPESLMNTPSIQETNQMIADQNLNQRFPELEESFLQSDTSELPNSLESVSSEIFVSPESDTVLQNETSLSGDSSSDQSLISSAFTPTQIESGGIAIAPNLPTPSLPDTTSIQVDEFEQQPITPNFKTFDTSNQFQKGRLVDEKGNVGGKINNKYFGLTQIDGDFSATITTPTGQTITKSLGNEVEGVFEDKTGKLLISIDNGLYDYDEYINPENRFVPSEANELFTKNGFALTKEQEDSDKPAEFNRPKVYDIDIVSSGNNDGKDIYGNPISKDSELEIYKDWQNKGYGKILPQEYNGRPQFEINDNSKGAIKALLGIDDPDAYDYLKASRDIVNPVIQGARIETEAANRFIEKYGRNFYDTYGLMPDSEVQEVKNNLQKEQLISQGYTQEQADEYIVRQTTGRLQSATNEAENIVRNIIKPQIDKRTEGIGLSDEDISSRESSEHFDAFMQMAKQYPEEFINFYSKNKDWDFSKLINSTSYKNAFFEYLNEDKSYQYVLVNNKIAQANLSIKKGAEQNNAETVDSNRESLNKYNQQKNEEARYLGNIAQFKNSLQSLFKKEENDIKYFRQLEAGYRSNDTGALIEYNARRIGDIPYRFIGDWVGSAATLFGASDSTLNEIKAESRMFTNIYGIRDQNVFDKVIEYSDSKGNKLELVNGRDLFRLDSKGNRTVAVNDTDVSTYITNNNLKKENEYSDFNGANFTAEVAKITTDMISSGALGKVAGSGLVQIATRLKNGLSEANYARKGLTLLSEYASNPATTTSYAMATQYYGNSYENYRSKGYNPSESKAMAVFSTLMLANVNRIFPDIKLFEEADQIALNAYKLIAAGQSNEAKKLLIGKLYEPVKRLGGNIGKEISEESVFEPLGEYIVQNMGAIASGEINKRNNVDSPFDFSTETVSLTVGTVLLAGLIGSGGGNIDFKNSTPLQRSIFLHNNPEYIKTLSSLRNDPVLGASTERELNTLNTINKYLRQIPSTTNLTVEQTAEVVTRLQQREELQREYNNNSAEASKRVLSTQITNLDSEIETLLTQPIQEVTEINEDPTPTIQTPETVQGQTDEVSSPYGQTDTEATVETESSIDNTMSEINNLNTIENGQEEIETQNNDEQLESISTERDQQSENSSDTTFETSVQNEQEEEIISNSNLNTLLSLQDAGTQRDNIINNGNVGFEPNILQQEEQAGQENPQDTSETTISTGSETNAEIAIPSQITDHQSSNGRYTITETVNENGNSYELTDNRSGKPANISSRQKENYVAEIINSKTFPENEIDYSEGMTPEEVSNEIINNSTNPKEIAQLILNTPRYNTSEVVGSKDWAIAQVIGSNNINRNSYARFGDANNIGYSIARTYFAKKGQGKSIDVIAQEASEVFNRTNDQFDSITTEDIVNFIHDYPNDPSKAERPDNVIYQQAVDRFVQLTGMRPTKSFFSKILNINDTESTISREEAERQYDKLSAEAKNNLHNEYDQWYNSLTLQQQTEEDVKNYEEDALRGGIENDSEIESNEAVEPREGSENATTQSIPQNSSEIVNENTDIPTSVRELASLDEGELSAAVFNELSKGDTFRVGNKTYEVTTKNTGKNKTEFTVKKTGDTRFYTKSRITLKEITTDGYGKSISGELINYSHGYSMFTGGNNWNNLSRDIEGDILTDLLNENNPFHEKSQSFKLAQKFLDNLNQSTTTQPTNSPEYNQLLKDRAAKEAEVRTAKANLDQISRQTNRDFASDQENLFGERASQNQNQLFDERADAEAGRTVLNEARNQYDTARQELADINNRIRSIESGENVSTGQLVFQQSSDNYNSITPEAFNNLINRLKNVFGKAFQKLDIITDRNTFVEKANELGFDADAQVFTTSDGDIYGAKLPDGTIYLNPDRLNANTAIHEFSHLWEQVMPNAWKKGLNLFKQTQLGKDLFNQLKNEGNYSHLTDSELWSEAMNTHIGNIGEERFRNPRGKMAEFIQWLKKIFANIGERTGINKLLGRSLTAEDNFRTFTEGVIGDLLGNRSINPEEGLTNNRIQFSVNSKSLIPAKTVQEVIQEIQNKGTEAGLEKLRQSSWFQNLSKIRKEEITANNLVPILIKTEQDRQQVFKIRGKEKIQKVKDTKDSEIKDIKKTFREKISEMKKDYKDLKSKFDMISNAKQRLGEKIFWRKQASNSIKVLLRNRFIKDKITPNETAMLLGLADKMMNARDINRAFDNFQDALESVVDKAERRGENTKLTEEKKFEKYNDVRNQVEQLINEGKTLEDIRNYNDSAEWNNYVEKAYYRLKNEEISPEQASLSVAELNKKEVEIINPKIPLLQKFKKWRASLSKNTFDRQWLPKKYLNEIGARNTENRLVNMAGAASRGKQIFENAYDKIFKGLTKKERSLLDNIIQQRRIIAIDENREARNLIPVDHPDNMDKNSAKAYLQDVKNTIGQEKYNDLLRRADNYFTEFNNLLSELKKEGLINQETYDSISGLDYQPRVFLEHLLDYEENLSPEEKTFRSETGGLSKEVIRHLDEGSTGVLLSNAELLLATAIGSRYRAIMMNRVNKEFINEELPKAKRRFENISPSKITEYEDNISKKRAAKSKEERFYRYFKELNKKIIDNPIIGVNKNGNPVYMYDKTPQGYKKSYYFENGVRNEFFMEDELHEMWHDTNKGIDSDLKDKIGTLSGSHLIKAFATGYNPAFVIVNTPRDFLHAINFSNEYSTFIPKAVFQLSKDTAIALREIYRHNRGNETLLTKYIEYGGGMDFLNTQGMLKNNSWHNRIVNDLIEPKQKELMETVLKYASLKNISNYSEVGFRVAVFKRAIDNEIKKLGKKDPKIKAISDLPQSERDYVYENAVRQARDLMDFNQGGIWSKNAESVVPYFNAGVQGTRVVLQQFKRKPYETTMKVLQTSVMGVSAVITLGMIAMSKIRDDEDDDESTTLKYLDFLETLSPYQKTNFFNIPTGYDKNKKTYTMVSIAKSQGLTPMITLTEDLIENTLRASEEKKQKDWKTIYNNVGFAFTNNVDPSGFSGIFTNGEGLRDIPEAGGKIIAKNPAIKSMLTYLTGYDFFFEQPLQGTTNNTVHKFEGSNSSKVEDFYKQLGLKSGLSPVRTKAFVESFVTSPTTNPFVGMIYGGLDIITTDKTLKDGLLGYAGYDDKGNFKINKIPVVNRAIRETTEYSRQLNIAKEVKTTDAFQESLEKEELMKNLSDKIAKRYETIGEAAKDRKKIVNEIVDFSKDQNMQEKMAKRIENKLSNKNIDGRVWDIAYSTGTSNEAKAILIYSYFGDVRGNVKIQQDLKQARVWSKAIQAEYIKLLNK